MAEVEELLDEVTLTMPTGPQLRGRAGARRTRRRAAGALAGAALLAGAVAGIGGVLPGQGSGEGPATKVSDESARHRPPRLLYTPDGTLDWKKTPSAGDWPRLPALGGPGACVAPAKDPGAGDDVTTYTALYKGKGGALARQREYWIPDAAEYRAATRSVHEAIAACGLTEGKPLVKNNRFFHTDSTHGEWLGVYVRESGQALLVTEVRKP